MSEAKPQTKILELTLFHRLTAISFMILSAGLFGLTMFLLPNYAAFKIQFLGLPSLVDQNPAETHYIKNAALIVMFWIQHIVMATVIFKNIWLRQFKYFALYQRYIYNILSGIAILVMFMYLEPSSSNVLFDIPVWICFPLSLAGAVLYYWSLWQVGSTILMPFKLSDLLYSKTVSYIPFGTKNRKGIIASGIYAYTRNPMQAGLILSIGFAHGHYTVDRLIYVGIMWIFTFAGTFLEQKRMLEQFVDYKPYMEKVKSRFFPF